MQTVFDLVSGYGYGEREGRIMSMISGTSLARSVVAAGLFGAALAGASGEAAADPLTLSGSVTDAGSYSISALQALGSTTESVTIGSGPGAVTDTFTGVSLWTLLGGTASGASDVVTGTQKNAILSNYIVATGTNGSQSLISLGEIDPAFGGTGPQYLVAYAENGQTLSAPKLIVPQDSTGTRDISSLASLNVAAVPAAPVGPGGLSTQFKVSGAVSTPGTYTLSSLQAPAFQAITDQNVTYIAGGGRSAPDNYTGVSFWSLLTSAGMNQSQATTSYVVATGTDGYQVVFSAAELNPAFGAASDLVAYADSADNGTSLGSNGFARLVLPGDNHGGRYVSNLSSIEVGNAVPEPNSGMLILPVSLGMIALARFRTRRGLPDVR
jgi:DMSO/TMAO reductase YedYZ molybdopterin-dependent catalytic subunit